MDIVVSPYHLTTREPAALAAMLLADRVVTMLPAPLEGKQWGSIRSAAERVPRYFEFMQSWQWTMPLWNEGVIASAINGNEAVEDLRPICERIERDGHLAPLRSLMKPDLFEDHEQYLDALARDLLKAGPDPAITVPVAAGLDLFALRHGAMVARSDPSSIVQQAEVELGVQAFAAAVPVLLQADAEHLLDARDLLEPELRELRNALDAAAAAKSTEETKAILASPCRAYSEAFDSNRETLMSSDPDDEVRTVEGTVMLTGMYLPPDCVLESSLRAMQRLGVNTAASTQSNGTHRLPGAVGGRTKTLSLYVRVLGRPAPVGRR